ncbi:LUD domain-containing protein [Mesorhizobium sp. AR02]|uniref:LutC/YkgG family protein n=1 Tax=Mesorhizobium sp. AR02 TaxID=2865837 RepID=UPI00215F77A6|nr:LUD domain-containing protein [Mesorhizobium sp. AR02]UVK53629.1 LUD domain-containing protein [Mesorhizobium sp. AR02]
MTSRDVFLAKIRKAQPSPVSLPIVPLFATPAGDRVSRFATALTLMGGTCITLQGLGEVRSWVADRFGPDAVIASAARGIDGNRAISSQTLPVSLEDVTVGIVRARFGVAETGSVWFSEDEYVVNAIGYLVQHLVVLLDPAQIEDGLQEAYRRPDFRTACYAALVTGPSATADIEGVMIRGAQGVRSLTVALVP